MTPTLEQFQAATGSTEANAQTYYEAALFTFDKYKITEVEEVAAFCATIGVESLRLTCMEENLYYTHPERLADLFRRVFDSNRDGQINQAEIAAAAPYCRNPQTLSVKLYGGYHGRGAIQLTWEKNYRLHGERTGFNYVGNPELLKQPLHAILSAGSFWDLNGINAVASNMDEVTLRVNGPRRLGLAERIALRDTALGVLA